MKHWTRLGLAALLALPGLASGQAYQLNLFGTKQIGMGHAGIAFPQDGAALAFNPASITRVRNGITVGVSPVNVQSSFVENRSFGQTYETDNPWKPPFHAYGIWGPEDSPFKFGLGVYTPFGGGYQWSDNWIGADALQSLELQAFFIQPTVAYAISDKLSIGASFIYAFGNVNLQRRLAQVNFPDGRAGQVELDGNANGVGFSIGAHWQPNDDWAFALNYRHEVTMEATDGDARFTVPTSLYTQFPQDNTFSAELPLPGQISIGTAYSGIDRWTIAFDFNYILWSTYENLSFNFRQDNTTSSNVAVTDQVQARNYDDALAFRLGAQYALIEDKFDIRFGGYYSLTPIKDGFVTPESPDNDRVSGHVGFSWHASDRITIDGAFQYLRVLPREDFNPATNLSGTWSTHAFIPSLALNYTFGR